MSCNHDFVWYQPFRGEGYMCCKYYGCGITQADCIKQQYPDPLPHPWKDTPKERTMAEIADPKNMIEAAKKILNSPLPQKLFPKTEDKKEENKPLNDNYGIYTIQKPTRYRSPIKDKP